MAWVGCVLGVRVACSPLCPHAHTPTTPPHHAAPPHPPTHTPPHRSSRSVRAPSRSRSSLISQCSSQMTSCPPCSRWVGERVCVCVFGGRSGEGEPSPLPCSRCRPLTPPPPSPPPPPTHPPSQLNLIQYVKGQHVICAAPDILEDHLRKCGSLGLEVDPTKIVWTREWSVRVCVCVCVRL